MQGTNYIKNGLLDIVNQKKLNDAQIAGLINFKFHVVKDSEEFEKLITEVDKRDHTITPFSVLVKRGYLLSLISLVKWELELIRHRDKRKHPSLFKSKRPLSPIFTTNLTDSLIGDTCQLLETSLSLSAQAFLEEPVSSGGLLSF